MVVDLGIVCGIMAIKSNSEDGRLAVRISQNGVIRSLKPFIVIKFDM